MIREPDSTLKITNKDLSEPDLYRLNSIIKDLYDRTSAIKSGAKFYGTSQFDKISAQPSDDIPSPTDVVPWATISKYLSPQAVRESLVYRTWLGNPIRPLTSSEVPYGYSSVAISIVDTHSNRLLNYPAASYDIGAWFYETDRTSLYQVQSVAGVNQWIWISGQMRAVIAGQPADLGSNDVGFLFYSTNTFYTYRWDGAAWGIVPVYSDSIALARTSSGELTTSYHGATAGTAVGLTSMRSRGTPTAPVDVQVGDRLGFMAFRGYRGSAYWPSFFMDSYVDSLPTASTVSATTYLYTTNAAGSAAARWSLTGYGSIIPFATGTYDIGSSSLRVRDTYSQGIDLSSSFKLSPGATAGYVLTSDASGVGTWQAAAGSTIRYKIARASSTVTLTTSYSDVTGCSLSLDRDGVWEVIGVFAGFKTMNDSRVEGRLLNDGSAEPGVAVYGLNILYDGYYTITNTWIISITGQPKTVKLQALKVGTGTSWVQLTDSVISAKFLG